VKDGAAVAGAPVFSNGFRWFGTHDLGPRSVEPKHRLAEACRMQNVGVSTTVKLHDGTSRAEGPPRRSGAAPASLGRAGAGTKARRSSSGVRAKTVLCVLPYCLINSPGSNANSARRIHVRQATIFFCFFRPATISRRHRSGRFRAEPSTLGGALAQKKLARLPTETAGVARAPAGVF
jgi:hypothetical protein